MKLLLRCSSASKYIAAKSILCNRLVVVSQQPLAGEVVMHPRTAFLIESIFNRNDVRRASLVSFLIFDA